ncbi:MAG: hypothetical protein ACLGIB_03005 [Actinomycetota bacterium]
MATKAEVLTTRTSISSLIQAASDRARSGFAAWYRKGQLGDGGRDLARWTGARC